MAKLKMKSTVIEQKMIADGIGSMWLDAKEIAVQAKPGQFISVYSNDKSRVLPRPISICEIDREKGTLRIVYRVVGKGTEEFSKAEAGDSFESRYDVCLWTKTDASCIKKLCTGKRNPLLDFHGREDGMWSWSLSCLCMSV